MPELTKGSRLSYLRQATPAVPTGALVGRAAAEPACRALEALTAFARAIPEPLFVVDPEMTIEYINDHAASMLGRSPAALVGMKCMDLFNADACAKDCPVKKAMHSQARVTDLRTRVRRGDGWVQISVDAPPLMDAAGRVIGGMEIIRDITGDVELLSQVSDQREYANSIVAGIHDPFVIVDSNLKVTYINEAAAGAMGYTRQEVENRMTCREVMHADVCDSNCVIRACMTSGKPVIGARCTLHDRSGRPVPVVVSASALRNGKGDIIGGFELVRDVSEDTAIEAKLVEIGAAVAQASQTLASASEETTATADQMANSATSLARDSLDVRDLSSKNGGTARQGVDSVLATLESMAGILGLVETIAGQLEDVNQKSLRISSIMAVINDVADQTNLLSLNAAIEAARAGEHGRGFAIVADEVRKLAERSASSAKEIAGLIEESQQSVNSTVSSVSTLSRDIARNQEGIQGAQRQLEAIVTDLEGMLPRISSVAAASEEMSASSEEVNAAAEEVAQLAQRLASMAAELTQTAARFGQR